MPYFIRCQYKQESMRINSPDLTLSSKVKDLLGKIYAQWFNGVTRELVLICSGTELGNKNSTLEDYEFQQTRNQVEVVLGNQGGNKFPSNIKTTKTMCVFYYMEYDCAELECGCYMSHVGVTEFIKSCNDHLELLKCPQCKKILQNIGKILYLANYENDDDYERYYKKFKERYRKENKDQGTQSLTPCPSCKVMNKKPNSLRTHKIKCGGCKINYCFECEGKWRKSGTVLCGNTSCDTWDTQYHLTNCKPLPDSKRRDWVKTYNNKWAKSYKEKIPSLRACPGCWRLLTVVRACQHITCEGCKHQFCYVCLKNWSGHNATTCLNTKPHPRQILN